MELFLRKIVIFPVGKIAEELTNKLRAVAKVEVEYNGKKDEQAGYFDWRIKE